MNTVKMNTLKNYETQFRDALHVRYTAGVQHYRQSTHAVLKHPVFTAFQQQNKFVSNLWFSENDIASLGLSVLPSEVDNPALVRLKPQGEVEKFWNMEQIKSLGSTQYKPLPSLSSFHVKELLDSISHNYNVQVNYNASQFMVRNNAVFLCETDDLDLLNMELLQALIIAVSYIPKGNIMLTVELTARLLASKFNFEYLCLQSQKVEDGWDKLTLRDYELALENAKSLSHHIAYKVLGKEHYHKPEAKVYKQVKVSKFETFMFKVSVILSSFRF